MTSTETRKLRSFFGLDGAVESCHLYLPIFSGQASLDTGPIPVVLTSTAGLGGAFHYPGRTFADRDAKAASYISSVLSRAVDLDNIQWKAAATFTHGQAGTNFVFGSRSNQAAEAATGDSALGRFLRFEFGSKWSIRCAGGRVFSLSAPDKLSRDAYERKTDYGVIGRFRDPDTHAHIFLIAGLGSRATEGCGYYLAQHWQDLARTFGDKDFAVVRKFPPPIDPKHSQHEIAFDDDHVEGFLPER